MRMNYMSKIAEMLGIELNEEFDIEPQYINPYEFAENYCHSSYNLGEIGLFNSCGEEDSKVLSMLLTGEVRVVKK